MEEEMQHEPGLISKDGVMIGTLTKDRVLVLPAKFWNDVKFFLERAFGRSVNVALSGFAEEFGVNYAEKMKGLGMDPAQAIGAMSKMAAASGWGRVKVLGDFRRGESFEVEVLDCAFCPTGVGDRCDFVARVAAGVAKSTYGSEYVCDHVRTELGAEGRCTLTLKKNSKGGGTQWRTAVHFPWMIDGR